MSVPVSALTLGSMALAALVCVAIPLILLFYYKRKGAQVSPFFVGCAVFILFALILEALVHNIVLKGLPVGEKIVGNTLLYAIYGGLMAGLFEETGRFAAFRTVLKGRQGNDRNALMYGAGHGGIEAVLLLSATYGSYIALGIMMDMGLADKLTAGLSGEMLTQMQALLSTVAAMTPLTCLLAILERCAAMTLHISLSVLVWFAAKKPGKFSLYPLAILLHALADGLMVVLAARLPVTAVEGCLVVMAAVLALIARAVWKRERNSSAVSEICPAGK